MAVNLGVKHRLWGIAALGMISVSLVGGVGLVTQSRQTAALNSVTVKLQSLRNHLEADMMHDALRGDVLAALLAGKGVNLGEADELRQALAEHAEKLRGQVQASLALPLSDAVKAALNEVKEPLEAYVATAETVTRGALAHEPGIEQRLPGFLSAFSALEDKMEAVSDVIEKEAQAAEAQAAATSASAATGMWTIIGLAGLALSYFSFALIRTILEPLGRLRDAIDAMGDTGMSSQRLEGFTAEFAAIGTAFNRVIDGLETQRLEQQRRADDALRIKVALDNVTAGVMMTDTAGKISYFNRAVESLLRRAESEIRRELPQFSVADLAGSHLDQFSAGKSGSANSFGKSLLEIGGRSFELIATPVKDVDKKHLGTAIEWTDLTDQLKAERALEQLIRDAIGGQLDRRLDPRDFGEGFLRTLAESFNKMLDAVVSPIFDTVHVMGQVAECDLRDHMREDYAGEFKTLSDSVNRSIGNLLEMVSGLQHVAGSLKTAAREIASGNQDLSRRTEEQAASLQLTANNVTRLAESVARTAENTREAKRLAAEATERAHSGGAVAKLAITAMENINDSSRRIAGIIGVIDEIAFQTNLLALNAAVEAARAGEQGRGFAVVATEVRLLAQRSAAAAKEIKGLIQESVGHADAGSSLVRESGDTLEQIVAATRSVNQIIEQIASASSDQAGDLQQISQAVVQLEETTQHNAAMVEQIAASSDSMDERTTGLADQMALFKVA